MFDAPGLRDVVDYLQPLLALKRSSISLLKRGAYVCAGIKHSLHYLRTLELFMTRLFVYFLSVSLFCTLTYSPVSAATSASGYLASTDVRQKTLAYSKAFQGLATKVDSRFYSIDGLADALDYDVEAAVAFVANEISYDPYLGVMRGADGAISTEAGSTWDQAVLLAGLINTMGGEAMLALGKLPKAEAAALLARGVVGRQLPSDRVNDLDVNAYFKQQLGINAITPVPPHVDQNNEIISYQDYSNAADKITSRLVSQLKAEGQPLAKPSMITSLDYAKQLGDEYVWVRYRDTPHQPWTDAHPVYAGEVPPQVTAEKYISAKVPQEKLHKIAIQFHIETQLGETYKRVAVSQPYIKPAANLASAQLRIGISPNTVGLDDEPSFYTPIIEDAFAPGAKSFTIMGQTVSPEDAAAGPAIFATVGSKLGSAIGSISGDDKNVPKLTGVILTITHIAPGGTKNIEERRLTDFRQGKPENYHLELFSRGVLEVDVGPENGARNLRDFLTTASVNVRQLPYFQAVLDGNLQLEELVSHPAFSTIPSHTWLQTLALGNSMAPKTGAGRVVRTSPLVMLKRDVIGADKSVKFAIDIQHNRVRGFSINQQGQAIENPVLALKQGVMETLMEGELLGLSRIADWQTEDQMRLISTSKSLTADPMWQAVSPTTQERMLADLNQAGNILIPNNQQANWWRVDTASGTLLGMGTLGGTDAIEEGIVLQSIAIAVTLGFMTYGLISGHQACMGSGKSAQYKSCCLKGVVILNVGLVAVGGVLGAATGAATGILSSITFDVVTGVPYSPVVDLLNQPQELICNWAAD